MCEVLLEASAFDFGLEEAYIRITRVSEIKMFKVFQNNTHRVHWQAQSSAGVRGIYCVW